MIQFPEFQQKVFADAEATLLAEGWNPVTEVPGMKARLRDLIEEELIFDGGKANLLMPSVRGRLGQLWQGPITVPRPTEEAK